ncbi:MAG: HlyD family efflux transporter periplasmic adaptor subunit [Planctomycetales bacterium]|nr:HlyD family efflux transporter periplasmic adaptor subunit [Planctomycetales bacterium]
MVHRLLIALLVVAALAGLVVYSQIRPTDDRVSGIVEADEIRVGSRVGGRVQSVHVEEGDRVEPGELLIELEPFDLTEQLQQAKAELAARQAEYNRYQAGLRTEEIGQAQAHYEQLQARLDRLVAGPRKQEIDVGKARLEVAVSQRQYAAASLARVREARASNAATPQDLDQAITALQAAEGEVAASEEELSLLEAGTREEEIREARAGAQEAQLAAQLAAEGYRNEDIAAAQAARDAAAATVAALEARVEELSIRAPVAGVIESLEIRKGDLASAGAPVLAILADGRLWVRAYVPDNRLDVKTGQQVAITVDSFPDQRFAAEITYISRQAEFTPSNVQTPQERVKQVFRIKATLTEGLDKLRPGMPTDVWLTPQDAPHE